MKCFSLLYLAIPVVHGLPRVQTPLGYPTSREFPFDQSFDKIAEKALKDYQVPGFSVSIVDCQDTHAKGYGIARFPSTKATADTLYFTASTTKSFTAASILKLIEEYEKTPYQLSLRTKIIDIVPWKLQDDYVTTHATLEDALSHRTGLPRHDMSYGGPNFTIDDLLRSLPHLPLTREIRQEFQYCNIMFVILTRVIEKLSGTSIAQFFKNNIWQPLGMNNTFMNVEEAKMTGLLADGHWFNNDTGSFDVYPTIDPLFVAGAGGAISSVTDYAKYLRAMLNDDLSILSAASYRELRTGRIVTPSLPLGMDQGPAAYSLGWFVSVYEGYELIQHTGGVPGFATLMLYVPELDWAVSVMANAAEGGSVLLFRIGLELLGRRIKLRHVPDVDGLWRNASRIRLDIMKNLRAVAFPDAPPPDRAVRHALPLAAYTGVYQHPAYQRINITLAPAPTYVGVPVPSTGDDGRILHADVQNRTWPHVLDFEHVNAEHFLVRTHYLKDAKNFDLETEAMRAEFEVGSDSTVSRMGLGYEAMMGKDLIWFERV
ncbi:uncharacterized protein PV09_08579 [Verruconis gallopava]|uniref:Beta-lactamase-related domain-containing protein n=1 Tax=Verruconis gallopava TaxID=253628 RepID=A0A0D2AL38_9PEZI|nr:uncharacterized protein PV09_08579 [Verruconis gallopava]KIV99773.1 hypothetical protein PV09_08579 [Verruconis gallopava]